MNDLPKHPLRLHTTHRAEALSDGVFAIAMTVLVFDLKLPNLVHHEDCRRSALLSSTRH